MDNDLCKLCSHTVAILDYCSNSRPPYPSSEPLSWSIRTPIAVVIALLIESEPDFPIYVLTEEKKNKCCSARQSEGSLTTSSSLGRNRWKVFLSGLFLFPQKFDAEQFLHPPSGLTKFMAAQCVPWLFCINSVWRISCSHQSDLRQRLERCDFFFADLTEQRCTQQK